MIYQVIIEDYDAAWEVSYAIDLKGKLRISHPIRNLTTGKAYNILTLNRHKLDYLFSVVSDHVQELGHVTR